MKWEKVKQEVNFYKQLKPKNDWIEIYKNLNDFKYTEEELRQLYNTNENAEIKIKALNQLNILKDYTYRKDFNNVITVKLVIPSGCNAKCEFCYNKNNNVMSYNKEEFLNNFINSLEYLIMEINGRQPISLDITGNEPTFDTKLLIKVLLKLRRFYLKDKICRITITTNGFNLDKVIPYFKGVIDYINISIHHYDKEERDKILGTKSLSIEEYRNLIAKLLDIGIDASAVCVIHKDISKFNIFLNNFIFWCKEAGFQSLRIRNNVFWKNSKFKEYMQQTINRKDIHTIQYEDTNDSLWCRLSDPEGFFIFMIKGVEETGAVTRGIEYVINDDGLCYTDFYKKEPIEEYKFPIGFIFDKKGIK
jgi:MoaA/NifB/PqqE/SkfB family radical SAM enzyme